MKIYTTAFLIFSGFILFAQRSFEDLDTREIVINTPNEQIEAQVKIRAESVKLNEDLFYSWYSNGMIRRTRGGFDGILLHGVYKSNFSNDMLKETGQYDNGLKKGSWKSWYSSGELKQVCKWKFGMLNGPYRNFDENGEIEGEGKYWDDRKSGRISFYREGYLESVKKFDDGIPYEKAEKPEKVKKEKREDSETQDENPKQRVAWKKFKDFFKFKAKRERKKEGGGE